MPVRCHACRRERVRARTGSARKNWALARRVQGLYLTSPCPISDFSYTLYTHNSDLNSGFKFESQSSKIQKNPLNPEIIHTSIHNPKINKWRALRWIK
jgi:hypothetical protein